MNIEELIKENKELKAKLNQGKECPDYSSWEQSARSAAPTLVEYIEAMAAAFCKFTNINPHDCVLHTGITEDGKQILYWFENKKGSAESRPSELGVKHIEKTNYISS